MLCAAAGVEHRAPVETSDPLQRVIARLRAVIPPLAGDRYMAPELASARELVSAGAFIEGLRLPVLDGVR